MSISHSKNLETVKKYALNKCDFAIAQVRPSKIDARNRPSIIQMLSTRYGDAIDGDVSAKNPFFCVNTVRSGVGTINETLSCSAGYLDPSTGKFSFLTTNPDYSIVRGNCSKENILKLLRNPSQLDRYTKDGFESNALKALYGNFLSVNPKDVHFNNLFEMYLIKEHMVGLKAVVLTDPMGISIDVFPVKKKLNEVIDLTSQIDGIALPTVAENKTTEKVNSKLSVMKSIKSSEGCKVETGGRDNEKCIYHCTTPIEKLVLRTDTCSTQTTYEIIYDGKWLNTFMEIGYKEKGFLSSNHEMGYFDLSTKGNNIFFSIPFNKGSSADKNEAVFKIVDKKVCWVGNFNANNFDLDVFIKENRKCSGDFK